LAKAKKNIIKRKNTALYKLKELIKEALSNKLTKALKYIKANYLNIGYIYWGRLAFLIKIEKNP
jgi:hypothetical protein